jgi:tetratricopeptide (TPR) repeat protein
MGYPAHADGGKDQTVEDDATAFRAIVKQGVDQAKAGDWRKAKANFELALSRPLFPKLSAEYQFQVYALAATAELYSDDADTAHQHIIFAGSAWPQLRDGRYWSLFCKVAHRTGKAEALVDDFTRVVVENPGSLKAVDDGTIGQIAREAHGIKDKNTRLLALLEALRAAGYAPPDIFWGKEWVAFGLAVTYAEKGDDVRAKMVAATLADPDSIRAIQVDRRYSHILPGDAAIYAKAYDRDIARLRSLAEANPDRLVGVHLLASALLQANRLPEALDRIDTALAKIDAAPTGKPAFSDLEELSWIYDTRARILGLTGRLDEAADTMKKAQELAAKSGVDVISQRINLAGFLVYVGRPDEALKAIAELDSKRISPYGAMAAAGARACAYALKGDAEHLKGEIDYVKSHASDGPSALHRALLCSGDLDALALQLISRLDDPDQRNEALVAVQTYLVPDRMTAWEKTIRERDASVLKRPEVKATIAKYGYIRSYPVFWPEL